MIQLKELYTNHKEVFDQIFDNADVIQITGATDKNDVIEKLNQNSTNYIGIRSDFNDHTCIIEHDENNYDKVNDLFGKCETIDQIIESLNKIIKDPKKLNKAISIGNHLPIRLQVNEAYDDRINKIMKKYGQGLKNCYDCLVAQIL